MDKNDWPSQENDQGYQPDITNYDYVWGSDQDEYVQQSEEAKSNEFLKQNEDFAIPEQLELPDLGHE